MYQKSKCISAKLKLVGCISIEFRCFNIFFSLYRLRVFFYRTQNTHNTHTWTHKWESKICFWWIEYGRRRRKRAQWLLLLFKQLWKINIKQFAHIIVCQSHTSMHTKRMLKHTHAHTHIHTFKTFGHAIDAHIC